MSENQRQLMAVPLLLLRLIVQSGAYAFYSLQALGAETKLEQVEDRLKIAQEMEERRQKASDALPDILQAQEFLNCSLMLAKNGNSRQWQEEVDRQKERVTKKQASGEALRKTWQLLTQG